MSQHIKSFKVDYEKWILTTFGTTFDGAPVRNIKPQIDAPYECVVIVAWPQQWVTPISRYVRLSVAGWAVRSSGTADLERAIALANGYADLIESAVGTGGLLAATIESGPFRAVDDESRIEFADTNLLLEVSF